jgi:hypothetical protein
VTARRTIDLPASAAAHKLFSGPLWDLLVLPEPHSLKTDSIEKVIQGLTRIYTRQA